MPHSSKVMAIVEARRAYLHPVPYISGTVSYSTLGFKREEGVITAEKVAMIGTTAADDPGRKVNPEQAKLQAIINLTGVLQAIAIILIDIRDGKKAPPPGR